MTDKFISSLEIPDQCVLNKPVFKKLFQENAELDATDKKALKDDIDRIRWLYTLKPSTINIQAYKDETREYDEIAILQIDLVNPTRVQRIAGFVNKAIPYPLVLIFAFEGQFCIALADKRINQADKSKWVVEEFWLTHWINAAKPTEAEKGFMRDCSVRKLPFADFYSFYKGWMACVIALKAAIRSGAYELGDKEKLQTRRESLQKIAETEREAAELRAVLKKETQFNRKLELNMAIKERILKISSLEKNL